MPKFSHWGKQQLKFHYELNVCDVRGLPPDVRAIAVVWERSGHVARSRTAIAHGSGTERMASIESNLRAPATLYRLPLLPTTLVTVVQGLRAPWAQKVKF